MIKTVEDGIKNYKRMLVKYLERIRDLKGEEYVVEGTPVPPENWDATDMNRLRREQNALQVAISILGITPEEEERFNREAYQMVMGPKTPIRLIRAAHQTVEIPCATKQKSAELRLDQAPLRASL